MKGQDLESLWPKRVVLRSEEIREAMLGPMAEVIRAIQESVGNVSPDLASDLIDNGLILAGGGALIPGIDRLIEERTGLRVRVAEDPMRAVVKGTGVFLEDLRRFAQVLNRGGGRSSPH